jgi:hypothetical protein
VRFPVFSVFHSFEEVIPGAEDGSWLCALPDGSVLAGEGNKREETENSESDPDSGFVIHGVFLSSTVRISVLDSARRYPFRPIEVKAFGDHG